MKGGVVAWWSLIIKVLLNGVILFIFGIITLVIFIERARYKLVLKSTVKLKGSSPWFILSFASIKTLTESPNSTQNKGGLL